MGYRIEYQPKQKKADRLKGHLRLFVLILMCFMLFLFLVETMWPDGSALIEKAVVSTKDVLTVSALNDLADELHYGEALITAFFNFYGKLIP